MSLANRLPDTYVLAAGAMLAGNLGTATPRVQPLSKDISFQWQDTLALAMAGAILVAWDRSGLDVVLARQFGNGGGFAWRDQWITAGLLHGGARVLAWVVIGLLVVGIWRPWPFMAAISRRERVIWLMNTALCVGAVCLLRHASATSCPWSLSEFGGNSQVHYVPPWMLGMRDGGPGGCFPSAHASAGFAFVSGWFALRRASPNAGRVWLAMAVFAGTLLTAVQMVRGAHFLSHGLWAGWICWAVAAFVHHLASSIEGGSQAYQRSAAS
jgi:membrane-associated PAP2 superfamily phosphatase